MPNIDLRTLWTVLLFLLQSVIVVVLLLILAVGALKLAGAPLTIGPKPGAIDIALLAAAVWALQGGRLV